MNNHFNRGFIPFISIILATVILTVASAGGYGVYKYRQIVIENAELKSQTKVQQAPVEERQKTSDVKISEKEASTTEATSSKEIAHKNTPPKEIVYTIQKSKVNTKSEIDAAVIKALAAQTKSHPIVTNSESAKESTTTEQPVVLTSPIKVNSVRQTSYPDGFGGTYGSYEMNITVTALGGDIDIPQSTTDTVGTASIGFSYSVLGGFGGTQKSRVSCSLMRGTYCEINDGTSGNITVTVWLNPGQYNNGNYAVQFDQISYLLNKESKIFDVNRKTANINLTY